MAGRLCALPADVVPMMGYSRVNDLGDAHSEDASSGI